MTSNREIESLDNAALVLERYRAELAIGGHAKPVNLAEERSRVLEAAILGRVVTPRFEYRPMVGNPVLSAEVALAELDVQGSAWAELLREDVIRTRDLALAVQAHDAGSITSQTISAFGRPSEWLLQTARSILESRGTSVDVDGRVLGAAEAIAELRDALVLHDLTRWKVRSRSMMFARMAVNQADRTVFVSESAQFSPREVARMVAHEIGTHVIRRENAELQPTKLLALPVGVAEPTEEGLAVVNEAALGLLETTDLERYALRVMASDLALAGSFAEVLEFLLDHTTPEDAVAIAIRVKRAIADVDEPGAHLKDVSYLAGYCEVLDHLRRSPEAYGYLMSVKQPLATVESLGMQGIKVWPLGRDTSERGRLPSSDLEIDWSTMPLFDRLQDPIQSDGSAGRERVRILGTSGTELTSDTFLRRVLDGAEARVHPVVEMRGVTIVGPLDLDDADLAISLDFRDCTFLGPIRARAATLRSIRLDSCEIRDLDLSSLTLSGDLQLNDCTVRGTIWLDKAEIHGALSLTGSRSPGLRIRPRAGEFALRASNLRIDTDLRASRLDAAGGLDLRRAQISGEMDLEEARIVGTVDVKTDKSTTRIAVNATRASIGGGVKLRDLEADGQLRLMGIESGGQINMVGLRARNPGLRVVNLQRAKAPAVVARGMTLEGEFHGDGVRVDGPIHLGGLRLTGPKEDIGVSLVGSRASTVSFSATLRADPRLAHLPAQPVSSPEDLVERFTSQIEGGVTVARAVIDDVVQLDGSEVTSGRWAVNLNGASVRRVSMRQCRFEAQGPQAIRAENLSCSGDFDLGRAHTDSTASSVAGRIDLDSASVGRTIHLARCDVRASGVILDLTNATVGENVDLRDAGLRSATLEPIEIAMRGCRVAGSVLIGSLADERARIDGSVEVSNATIDGDLVIAGIEESQEMPLRIDASRTRVGGALVWRSIPTSARLSLVSAKLGELDDRKEDWPQSGNLDLHGMTFETLSTDAARATAADRVRWLRLQDGFSPDSYEQLQSYYRAHARPRSAERVALGFHRERITREPSVFKRILMRFWLTLTGYGERLERVAVVAALTFAALAVFAVWAGQNSALIPSDAAANAEVATCTSDYPCFNALLYAADVVAPIIDLGQAEYWVTDLSQRGGRWFGLASTVGRLVGWLALSIVAIGFARRFSRE